MTEDLRAVLRDMVAEAERQRWQLLKDVAGSPEGLSGPQHPSFVLGLLMFYGRAFAAILELPHSENTDTVVMRVMDVARVGLVTFLEWQRAQTSLSVPPELDVLTDCWCRLVVLSGASSAG